MEEIIYSINTLWVLIAAALVFFMQAGFALVEAGLTRSKNTANILMKNLMDYVIGTIAFWAIGFGIMFGTKNGWWGGIDLFTQHTYRTDMPDLAFLIFQTVFAATAATIVSGAMAERTKFNAYLIYSAIISLIIYPISGHWAWGGGWLSQLEVPFHDFAGSTVVHMVGGLAAMVGALILGPRIGKYGKNGKVNAIPGHNLPMATLGVFILWIGWFGFNPGSQLAAAGTTNAKAISLIFVTTNIAAAGGALSTLLFMWFKYKKPPLSMTLNGALAGLVAITAGCDAVSPGGALIIGALAGILVVLSVEFFDKVVKIDDPVGAISVHGICGAFGTLMVGFFSTSQGVFYGHGFGLFKSQAIGVFSVAVWAIGMSLILFIILKYTNGLRVSHRIEEEGLDIYEHGESAYN
ncbi:MAG TPA: ammonium transporter [Marinilabiliales bacterium]|jgi:Amt family ammonium transporter|nr:MAG: ammonium transporter [Bacteroidetes bacterium GWA2_40_14]OFX62515.1 MAG: ammonium transporter [Bacteroidetes bacterium GWC2_40_13]OFX73994.1 MAG: ammonium transporter [Bacteroidetes bacterium GWD2_40_43]OFX93172.1 MAG: ammonium transporter [Bacteroidetes bacterium GWE2_40_63]OFY21542.1 MAG: ammonium transporter [Bacteroidetes bacterium GWF2_40_13]OFZ24195.1 MAG: ammonium transporter [Bacteroidetes bacterium RIFOXYC2_FULL_40_12]HAM98061.1 ammonium transporter [Marinilabiliales bacteriu